MTKRKTPAKPATHRTPWRLEKITRPDDPPIAIEEIGHRFNRQRIAVFEDGRRILEAAPQDHHSEIKKRSIRALRDAGITVPDDPKENADRQGWHDAIIGAAVDPSKHSQTSPAGLAARLLFLCVRLEQYEAEGAPARLVIPIAQALGRLDALAMVYRKDDEFRAAGQREAQRVNERGREKRAKTPPATDEDRAEWVRLWDEEFKDLTANRAAPLIAERCGADDPTRYAQTIRKHLGETNRKRQAGLVEP